MAEPVIDTISLLGCAEPMSSWLHLGGALIALMATPALARTARTDHGRLTLVIFGLSAACALALSGAYHLQAPGTAGRDVMQRLDHAGIWLLIAATFTPVHAIAFKGLSRWGMLLFIWAAALAGIVLKTMYFHSFPTWLGLLLYLALGWLGVVSIMSLARRYPFRQLKPLLVGGLLYSVGGILSVVEFPTIWPGVIGHHELFHVAVLLALAAHWRFMAALPELIHGEGGVVSGGGYPALVARQPG